MMKKTFTKKVMTRLTKDINYDCNTDHDVSNFVIKSKDCLQGMMKQGLPCHKILSNAMPFVNASNKHLNLSQLHTKMHQIHTM